MLCFQLFPCVKKQKTKKALQTSPSTSKLVQLVFVAVTDKSFGHLLIFENLYICFCLYLCNTIPSIIFMDPIGDFFWWLRLLFLLITFSLPLFQLPILHGHTLDFVTINNYLFSIISFSIVVHSDKHLLHFHKKSSYTIIPTFFFYSTRIESPLILPHFHYFTYCFTKFIFTNSLLPGLNYILFHY